MEDNENEPELKVVDKRRFDETGEAKPGLSPEREAEPSGSSAPKQPAPAKEKLSPQPAKPESPAGAAEGSAVDFSSFIVSLATQAMMMLGEMPHPETQQLVMNLDAARQTIDIIAVLEEKTAGNLTDNEKNLVSEILSSLRMAYVSKVKPNG